MNDRELVLKAIEEMPEDASFDEIVDELKLLASIHAGLEDTANGRVTPHEQVLKQFKTWITKSSGRTAA